jgi:hypothetical protein
MAEVCPGRRGLGARMVGLANSKALTLLSILIVTTSIILQVFAPDFATSARPSVWVKLPTPP